MAIGVALIGSGIFAKESHLPAIQQSSNLSLKAVYSRSRKSAESLGTDTELYSDDSGAGKTYHDLLLRPDVDAVIIALPILSQPEYIEAALAAGKHVLSEKPIAGDLKAAKHLIQYYNSDKVKGGATWGVAENYRFLDSFQFGRKKIQEFGRVLGFRVKTFGNVKPGSKYFETPWRKKAEHQGGFLLDGGVHFVAATRLLLGETAKPKALSAFSTLLQEHLGPVDTVNSIWVTKSGISGTFSISFGTTLSGNEYTVACEKGSVSVVFGANTVTVREGEENENKSEIHEFKNDGNGVKQEVAVWAQGIVDGKPDPRFSPEEALVDLEIVEKMLKSGQAGGELQTLE